MDDKPDKSEGDSILTTRRRFLNVLLGGAIATTLIGTLIPIIEYIYPPKKSEDSTTNTFSDIDLKPILVDSIPENSGVVGLLNEQNTIVIKKNEKLFAFSAICTHLGCTVKWDGQQEVIKCPCHGGTFDLNGKVLAGPAPKPLKLMRVTVIDNKIVNEGA